LYILIVTTTVEENKLELAKCLRILRNIKEPKNAREVSYARIIELVQLVETQDSKFEFNSTVLDGYKEFKTNGTPKLEPKIKWPEGKTNQKLKDRYNEYVALAVEIVGERTKENPDSNVFGQIVSATIGHLIQIDIVDKPS